MSRQCPRRPPNRRSDVLARRPLAVDPPVQWLPVHLDQRRDAGQGPAADDRSRARSADRPVDCSRPFASRSRIAYVFLSSASGLSIFSSRSPNPATQPTGTIPPQNVRKNRFLNAHSSHERAALKLIVRSPAPLPDPYSTLSARLPTRCFLTEALILTLDTGAGGARSHIFQSRERTRRRTYRIPSNLALSRRD